MRVTRKAVNKALEDAGFEGVTIERGDGYWYFWGGEAIGWYDSSVSSPMSVPRLTDLTVDQWVHEAQMCKEYRR